MESTRDESFPKRDGAPARQGFHTQAGMEANRSMDWSARERAIVLSIERSAISASCEKRESGAADGVCGEGCRFSRTPGRQKPSSRGDEVCGYVVLDDLFLAARGA